MNNDCCFGFCARFFGPAKISEEEGIPFCRSVSYYSSINYTAGSLEKVHGAKVVDIQMPLSIDEEDNLALLTSTSPPDLIFLSGDKAFDAYDKFLKNSSKAARGPDVVDNVCKSKSFSQSFDFQSNRDEYGMSAEDSEAKLSDNPPKILKKKSSRENDENGIRRSSSSEKKVLFYAVTSVRSFESGSDSKN